MSTLPKSVDLQRLGEPFYLGSVQNLYHLPHTPEFALFETTNSGSVFDVGSIFKIEGNDLNRAIFRHIAYTELSAPTTWHLVRQQLLDDPLLDPTLKRELLEGILKQLCSTGALTHHGGMIDSKTHLVHTHNLPPNPSCFNLVKRFPLIKPPQRHTLGGYVYEYSDFYQNQSYVIPLEYIVRFGVTQGSSLWKKYQSLSASAQLDFSAEYLVDLPLQPWTPLRKPIFDFTSKYEPQDRAVTRQEALNMSGLPASLFVNTIKLGLLGAYFIKQRLAPIGLQLWDLKWEFAVNDDELYFVDTIDADSFRATFNHEVDGQNIAVHFNKQAMRDYYRVAHAAWYQDILRAKKDSEHNGIPFKTLLQEGQSSGTYLPTPEVHPSFLKLQTRKNELITAHMAQSQSATQLKNELSACCQAEADFYRSLNLLSEWLHCVKTAN
jgi:phosphoribosylaminoimidazole-succinocarboxamide synthase